MVWVKICGITSMEDALAAVELGADALGFVFAPSPRRIRPEKAREIIRRLPSLIETVGVVVDAPLSWMRELRAFCGLDTLQLHGQEPPEVAAALDGHIIKAVHMGSPRPISPQAYPEATLLLDTYDPRHAGGTGRIFDWDLAKALARHRAVILAGGLSPENVEHAVGLVRPFGVDVSSGVEAEARRKDHAKMASFIRRAKGWISPTR